jgi:Protein of unknown function, DUF547
MKLDSDLVKVSQDFLDVAKQNKYAKTFKHHFEHLSLTDLKDQIQTEERKIAFWLNLYNGFVQVLLKEDPSLYRSPEKFYQAKLIIIAKQRISLSFLEQNIIYCTRNRVSDLFSSSFEKEFRLQYPNPLKHFALNNGSKSSPPIHHYEPDKLESQLTEVTDLYLKSESKYQANDNTLCLPYILKKYKPAFGGKKGVIELAKKFNLVNESIKPKLRYLKYDDTLQLNSFVHSDRIMLSEEKDL